jgi:2-methylcitrate dehydratase PrpD
MNETLLQHFSRFAAELTYERLPSQVGASVKHRALDTIGLCLAAAPLETSRMAVELARSWGGNAEATVIGFPHKLPAIGAGFANGVLAHSLDFDDTHLPSVLHPSASIIPATLAVSEAVGASGKDLIAAAAVGYELCVRSGMAAYDRKLGNSVFFERGWHATSICGTLGVAAAAAKLYGLDAASIGHAVAIAASMGSGVIEANRTGGSVKRLHCGWAAHAGLIAAQAARAGFTGPPSIFEGRFGFYQAFCGGQFNSAELIEGLGETWTIPSIFYKPYPANHFTHAGIDAAIKLRERVRIDEIEEIELGVASPTLRTIAEPREAKIRPQSGYHAQFSGPFTVATALIGAGGGLGLGFDDFSDARVRDPRYLELAAKVRCVANPECDAIFPNQFPAVLRVKTRDGRWLEERVMANRGGPDNPLSEDELKTKFLLNATRRLNKEAAHSLAETILHLTEIPVSKLCSELGGNQNAL